MMSLRVMVDDLMSRVFQFHDRVNGIIEPDDEPTEESIEVANQNHPLRLLVTAAQALRKAKSAYPATNGSVAAANAAYDDICGALDALAIYGADQQIYEESEE